SARAGADNETTGHGGLTVLNAGGLKAVVRSPILAGRRSSRSATTRHDTPEVASVNEQRRAARPALLRRELLNKVPEITIFFWIIKVLCTTVGETAADFLDGNLNLGLTNTTYLTGGLLAVALFFQFRCRRYVAGVYWLAV